MACISPNPLGPNETGTTCWRPGARCEDGGAELAGCDAVVEVGGVPADCHGERDVRGAGGVAGEAVESGGKRPAGDEAGDGVASLDAVGVPVSGSWPPSDGCCRPVVDGRMVRSGRAFIADGVAANGSPGEVGRSRSAAPTASDDGASVSGAQAGGSTWDGKVGVAPDGDPNDGGKKDVAGCDKRGAASPRTQSASRDPGTGSVSKGNCPRAVAPAPRIGLPGAATANAVKTPFRGISQSAAPVLPPSPRLSSTLTQFNGGRRSEGSRDNGGSGASEGRGRFCRPPTRWVVGGAGSEPCRKSPPWDNESGSALG